MTFRLIFFGLTLPALLSGCGYVGAASLEEGLCLLDQDGDGVPRGGDNCSQYTWTDAEGNPPQPLPDKILDCDDDPLPIADLNGNQFIKGKLRSPLIVDEPYDGIDNDCSGADNVDVDGDGFPGITQTDWNANFAATWGDKLTQAAWPGTVLFEWDCLDADNGGAVPANAIFPNNPSDTPYNDIDEDCGQDNDFDADGDKFASFEHAEAYKASSFYNPEEPATDCDDARSDVRPLYDDETEEDVQDLPYDGKDKRCDDITYSSSGTPTLHHNDFDADGDGWMPYGVEEDFERYVTSYGYDELKAAYTDSENNLKIGDCYDIAEPAALQGAPSPDQFFPGNADTPYDGYDTDCGDIALVDEETGEFAIVANDFDADADGYINEDIGLTLLQSYVARYKDYQWPEEGVFPFKELFDDHYGETTADVADYYDARKGDCADQGGGAALINPAALEKLGDSVDQDCDGNNLSSKTDTSRFVFAVGEQDFSVFNPSRPLVAVADQHYIVFSQVTNFKVGTVLEENVGMAFFLDRDEPSSTDDPPGSSQLSAYGYEMWWRAGIGEQFSGEIAGVAVNNSDFTVGFSYTEASRTLLVMKQYLHDSGADYDHVGEDNEQISSRTTKETYTGSDFQVDPKSGYMWLTGCNSSGVQYMAVRPRANSLDAPAVSTSTDDTWAGVAPTGTDCFIQTSEYVGNGSTAYVNLNTVDASGSVTTYRTNQNLSQPYASSQQPWSSLSLQSPYSTTNDNLLMLHQDNDSVLVELEGSNSEVIPKPIGGGSFQLIQADAVWLDDDLYIAGIYDNGGTPSLHLGYGDPNNLTWVNSYPLKNEEGTTLTPQGVGLAVDEDRVIMAVTTESLMVGSELKAYLGWAVMAPQD